MKPKTKHQKLVVELNKKIKMLTPTQKKWASLNCFEFIAVRNKGGRISCLHCGNRWTSSFNTNWKDEITKQKCSKCNNEVQIKATQKRVFEDWFTFTIFQKVKDYQVIRIIRVDATYSSGKEAKFRFTEASRTFISPKGKYEIVARLIGGWSYNFNGSLELRQNHTYHRYDVNPKFIYPRKSFIPEIFRNGFDGDTKNFKPALLFINILSAPIAETLFKNKQYNLLGYYLNNSKLIEKFWPTIKIAMRNKYYPTNASDYIDYIKSLVDDGRDILNKKYVCPDDLDKQHQKYLRKQREKRDKIQLAEIRNNMKIYEEDYKASKSKFFDLKFIEDDLEITPIKSVTQLDKESYKLSHCAFSSKYFTRENSLLFSIRVNNELVETAEVSLRDFDIIQIRGVNNKKTDYFERSLNLISKNIPSIRKAVKSKNKQLKVA